MSKPGDRRYTAWLDADGLTLIEDVHAGVSGPIGNYDRPDILTDADALFESRDFARVGEWTIDTGYKGLILRAELRRVDRSAAEAVALADIIAKVNADAQPAHL